MKKGPLFKPVNLDYKKCFFLDQLGFWIGLVSAPIRADGTGGMPPVNSNQRVAATRQF